MSISTERIYNQDFLFTRAFGYGKVVAKRFVKDNIVTILPDLNIRQDIAKYEYALENIIANGFAALRDPDTTAWVAYRARKKDWSWDFGIYGESAYAPTRKVLESLYNNGLIYTCPAVTLGDFTQRSAYRLSQKLIDIVSEAVDIEKVKLVVSTVGTCVIKSRDKQVIGRCDRTEKQLKKINNYSKEIRLVGPDKRTFDVQYNASHYQGIGGRIYTTWQREAKEYRAESTIDGEYLTEIDLTAAHMSLLYISKNLPLPERDIYDLRRPYPRTLVKWAVNIAINDSSLKSAKQALLHKHIAPDHNLLDYILYSHIRDTPVLFYLGTNSDTKSSSKRSIYRRHFRKNIPFLTQKNAKLPKVLNDLFADLKKVHKPVADLLFKDQGIVCQGIEGKLAIAVLEACNKAGIAAINVHDGFYTKRSQSAAFEAIFRHTLESLGLSALKYKIK